MKNILLLLVVVAGLASAHHGYAAFDTTAEVTLSGTVTDFHFVNPHCVVEFDVKDDKGQVHNWQGEFSNPGQLVRKGWTAASLAAGDKIQVSGYPAKGEARALHVLKIRMPSGQ